MIAPTPELKAITSHQLEETRYEAELSCGMKLIFAPRAGFNKKLAFMVVNYGSIDSRWMIDRDHVHVPDGIAHFLEHQVFKKGRADLSDVFAARGAYVNAHTGHTQTAYYFECVEQFEANLDTLFELVLTPYFDKKLVDIERNIIIQEINQYRDHPGWVGFQQMLESLFVFNPVRIDIAGTAETVSAVTPDLLALCHSTFYHPSNLTLVVCADMEPAAVLDLAEKLAARWAPATPPPSLLRYRPYEPDKVAKRRAMRRMFVSRPRMLMGFKDLFEVSGDELTLRDVLSSLALDAMFSRGSAVYEALYDQRLISSDFGAAFQSEPGFGYTVIGGETSNPDKLEAIVMAEIKRAREHGVDPEVIERKRRKYLGQFLRAFNEPEGTAYAYIGAIGQGSELFHFPAMVQCVEVEDVNRRIKEMLKPAHYTTSLILPQGK